MKNGIRKWVFNKLHLHDEDILYEEDQELKHDIDLYNYLYPSVIELQKRIVPGKIRHIFKHKPSFFVVLFLRLLFKLLTFFVVLAALAAVVMAVGVIFFNLKINLKAEPIKEETLDLIIYVPNVGVTQTDSICMDFYKRMVKNPKAKFVWMYITSPTKTYDKWSNDLAGLESKGYANPYEARRQDKNGNWAEYWGKYQMGESARRAVKMERYTWEEWKRNPALQEAALRLWVDILYNALESDIKKYDGQFLNGWHITTSGIIAMAHNVGPAPVKAFLHSNGLGIVPKDGSGRDATRFLVLGSYDLNFDK